MTDAQEVLRLCRHHFSTLLQEDGDINFATREDSKPAPIDDDGVKITPPSFYEVRIAIQLANQKQQGCRPDGVPAELFKAGGIKLVRSMHQIICRIWMEKVCRAIGTLGLWVVQFRFGLT